MTEVFGPIKTTSLADWESEHKGHPFKDELGVDGDVTVRIRRCQHDGQMIVLQEAYRERKNE